MAPIKIEFEQFESLVTGTAFPGNKYLDKVDADAFCNYLIVNMLAGNGEIGWPKSLYIHKPAGGKYTFGPVWDFDGSYGYEEETDKYFVYNVPIFNPAKPLPGSNFMNVILKDPKKKTIAKNQVGCLQAG